MMILALTMAFSTLVGVPKSLNAAWIDPHLRGVAMLEAEKAAGVRTASTDANGVFVFIKTEDKRHVRSIGSKEGIGVHLYAPAKFQLGNTAGLKEYDLESGEAICFASVEAEVCAVAVSPKEMRERTKPKTPTTPAP